MYCSESFKVSSIIFIIVSSLLALFAVYVLVQFVLTKKQDSISKKSHRLGIVFVIATILALSSSGTQYLFACYVSSDLYRTLLKLLYNASFATQSYLLLLIFYNKLRVIFKKTKLKLSTLTNRIYASLFVAIPIYVIVAAYIFVISPALGIFLVTFFLAIFVSLMISLAILFIYKLIQVYKSFGCKPEDEEIVTAITKTTVLTSISICLTFVDVINTVMIPNTVNIYWWVCHYVALCDIYTNFICIIMCYKSFKVYYMQTCFFLDANCRMCWTKIVKDTDRTRNNDINTMQKNVEQLQPVQSVETEKTGI